MAIGLAASVLVFSATFAASVQCAENAKPAWKPSTAGDDLFTNLTVFKFEIEIAPKDMETLRESTGTTGDPLKDRRDNVPCTVREGGKVYTNVAVHLKGSMGSFRSVDGNPGLTLVFDKFAKGQTFHGLKKISLNNSVQDPTYLHERLAREAFNRAGIPTPRAAFATVRLNRRDLGVRVLIEGS
jgi:spore coat protein CotH